MLPDIINVVQKGEGDVLKQLLLIFLGWLLGVITSIMMMAIAQNRSRKGMASVLKSEIENHRSCLEQDLAEIPRGEATIKTVASPLYQNSYSPMLLNIYASNLHLFSSKTVQVLIAYGRKLNEIQRGKELIRQIIDRGAPPDHMDLPQFYETQIVLTGNALELIDLILKELEKEIRKPFKFAL